MADAELKFYRCLTIHSPTILPAFLILATYQDFAIHKFEAIPVPRTCRDQLLYFAFFYFYLFILFLLYFFVVYLATFTSTFIIQSEILYQHFRAD